MVFPRRVGSSPYIAGSMPWRCIYRKHEYVAPHRPSIRGRPQALTGRFIAASHTIAGNEAATALPVDARSPGCCDRGFRRACGSANVRRPEGIKQISVVRRAWSSTGLTIPPKLGNDESMIPLPVQIDALDALPLRQALSMSTGLFALTTTAITSITTGVRVAARV